MEKKKAHPDRLRAKRKRLWQAIKADPKRLERKRARGRAWSAKNRSLLRAQAKARRDANVDAVRAKARRYYAKNKHNYRAYKKAYDAKHGAKIRARRRKKYRENLAVMRARGRASYARNRSKAIARVKRYVKANRKKVAEYQRQKVKRMKERDPIGFAATRLEYTRRRQARVKGATLGDSKHIRALYRLLRDRKRVLCYWCRQAIPKSQRTLDHVRPIAKGGMHHIFNLVPAHGKCNSRKIDKLPEDFAGQFEIDFTAS